MGRKKLPPAKAGSEIQIVHKTPPAEAAKEIAWREADAAALVRTEKLAKELRYDEELSIGAIEDGIRFFQRRTVECYIEVGKRLLLLKEIAPHGEFVPRIERLGFAERAAQKFMQAAAKTVKSAKLAGLVDRVKNPSVFVELIAADDDVLEKFSDLDNIDRMTGPEAKRTVRQLQAEIEAKDKRAEAREREIERKDAQLAKYKRLPKDEKATALRSGVSEALVDFKRVMGKPGADAGMAASIRALLDHAQTSGNDESAFIHGVFIELTKVMAALAEDAGVLIGQLGVMEG